MRWSFGDVVSQLDAHAWFRANSGDKTQPVGGKSANDWGLFDMHGNVWEWCEDTRHGSFERAPTDGSAWISGGQTSRVVRGGSWVNSFPRDLRSANRHDGDPFIHFDYVGFRLARTASPSIR